MASPARDISKEKRPASITEVIAAGADVVIERPMVMIVPILLDLYYLLGWKVIAGTTFDRLHGAASDLNTSEGDQIARFLVSAGKSDVTGLLSFVLPSFMAGANADKLYRPIDPHLIAANNWGALMLAVVAVLSVSMLLFGLFGLWLADTGLKRDRSWSERLRMSPVVGGRFILMLLLILGMVLLLCIPLILAAIIASAIGVGMEGLVLTVGVLVGVAFYLLFYFAPDSLLVDMVGPVQALRASSAVVRQHFFGTVGFALATTFISIGLADVWDRLATSAPGLAIAIIANAFVGCVLWIASLLFFSERSKLLALEGSVPGMNRSTP